MVTPNSYFELDNYIQYFSASNYLARNSSLKVINHSLRIMDLSQKDSSNDCGKKESYDIDYCPTETIPT